MTEEWINLSGMDALPELFKKMIAGRHIGRLNDSALWGGLECNAERYTELFAALGFELCIDQRGFAWLQNPREDQPIAPKIRQIAFLLLLVFERQAAHGRSLEEFDRWAIDRALLKEILIEQKDVLETESIVHVDALEAVMRSTVRYGFARLEEDGWRLLPAARRFTDQFEKLAAASELSMQDAPEETQR